MQPMYDGGPPVFVILLAVGIVALVLGFDIIRRITRGSDGPDPWRSRRRR